MRGNAKGIVLAVRNTCETRKKKAPAHNTPLTYAKGDTMWDYTPKVRDHFMHPRNVGEIENADAEALVGNISCGDALKLYLKIDKETGKITDAKFKTFGCASAIASSSMLTELLKGKTVDEAMKISNKDIADALGGLPEEKMHCSVMGMDALEKALAAYRGEALPEDDHDDDGAIVCKCFSVTDKKIEQVVRENNLTTVDEVTHYTKAGGGCGACQSAIEDIITRVRNEMNAKPEAGAKKPLTNIQKMKLIEQTLLEEVQPQLAKDGGGVELVDIDGSKVLISLRGLCAGCNASQTTIKSFIEPKLREFVDPTITVEEA